MKLINLENGKILNRKKINPKYIDIQKTIYGTEEKIYKQKYRIEKSEGQK